MKITLNPTEHEDYPTVSVSVKNDDLRITEIFEQLIIPVLLGYGYQRKTIDKYLDKLIDVSIFKDGEFTQKKVECQHCTDLIRVGIGLLKCPICECLINESDLIESKENKSN